MIKILNPIGDQPKYTSEKRAAHFIRRGEAILSPDGDLFFFQAAAVLERREAERIDAELQRNRGGVVTWAGSTDPQLLHRPGECRS